MKATITLIILSIFLVVTPGLAKADGRDRHDRSYQNDRDHGSYQKGERGGHDARRDHYWKKQGHKKHAKAWKKNRPSRKVVYRSYPRHVVYQPVRTRVVYREPAVYYPVSYLTVGIPNLSFHVAW